MATATDAETPIRGELRNATKVETRSPFPPADRMKPEEMLKIARCASKLFHQAYVHLRLKESIHAANPIERLRTLEVRLEAARHDPDEIDEAEFNDEMVSIFTSVRDLHTVYVLPEPYPGLVSFLPFMIEECHDGGRSRFVVSKLNHKVDYPGFDVGTEVLAWNGIPIERAVQLNGLRRAGSNRWARRARAIDALTFRWLGTGSRPEESLVTITYVVDRKMKNVTFPWWVTARRGKPPLRDTSPGRWMALGVDEESEWIRGVKRALFAPEETPENATLSTALPDVFRFGPIPDEDSPFGYLRIYTFNVDDEAAFFDEAVWILRELPKGGLILDVRGNSGGLIPAAERLLQLFTTRRIQPEPLRFRNTDLTLDLASSAGFELAGSASRKQSLVGSIRAGRYTGEPFSASYPLDPADAYNDATDDQRYPGPVVLIVDGLSYSATDIFAAGFQDHGIGVILGTAGQTGGGGANVWSYESIRKLLGTEKELPYKASFTMAMRASTRVGPRAGYPLEDLGVTPDVVHRPTTRDVLEGNRDLYARAMGILATLRATRVAVPVI